MNKVSKKRFFRIFQVFHFFQILLIFLSIILFASCKEEAPHRVVIWTDCSEFAQYIEFFNSTHTDTNAVLVYKENPAASLPAAKDELKPDIIVGSWLRTDNTIKYFKDLNYIFDRKVLTSSIFYPQLLEAGKLDYSQYLLPVSFNLPAIIFSSYNKDLITDNYTLNLEQIRTIASSYNKKKKNGTYTRIGFTPLGNNDFLYLTTKLYGVNFRDEKGQIVWNDDKLKYTVEQLNDWVTTENTSAQVEEDFTFKYLFMPDYRQVTSGRTLFAYTTSDSLFKTLKNQDIDIDYRWISDGQFIPAEDSFTMLGIYKDSPNQPGATEFIRWFFDSENQQKILQRKSKLTLNTELFGISGGFSSIRDITEHILPAYYTQLFTNLPPENMLKVPQNLPARWESYQNTVIEPYIKQNITGSNSSAEGSKTITLQELEKEWRKKVFD